MSDSKPPPEPNERPEADPAPKPVDPDTSQKNASDDLSDGKKRIRERFLNREAAEVYLLLDFLSGRTDRSLRPTADEQARTLLLDRLQLSDKAAATARNPDGRQPTDCQKNNDKTREEIEEDLKDPTRLLIRTMKINYPIGEHDENFVADAAFLMRARDVLNNRAEPATGATIAFTSMMSTPVSTSSNGQNHGAKTLEFANTAYPGFVIPARKLKFWIGALLWCLVILLLVTLGVSAYTSWGKVLLDTQDAVRRDDSAIHQTLAGRNSPPKASDTTQDAAQGAMCDGKPDIADYVITLCDRINEIKLRNEVTHYQLAAWEYPLRRVDPELDESGGDQARERLKTEQWATALVAVLGNYGMPILYGFLGSLAFVLRRHYDRLAASLLSPRDLRANPIRLALGAVIGSSIGLIYSGSGAAQTTGTLGLAVTLSTSAIAFLAGYGVEGVFKTLDALIKQVFPSNGIEKPPQQTIPT